MSPRPKLIAISYELLEYCELPLPMLEVLSTIALDEESNDAEDLAFYLSTFGNDIEDVVV